MTVKLHTVEEVAAMLGKTPDWVARQTRKRNGAIPHVKVGRDARFTDDHLKQYIDSLEKGAASGSSNPWGRKTRR